MMHSPQNFVPALLDFFQRAFPDRAVFPIPTLFAAVFGKAFIERYAAGEAVGDIMFDLRKKLLSDDNPLGLWYSLQCPLDLKAPVN